VIRLEKVSFVYPTGATALREVDLSIESGQFIAIMGENGAGKTTLAKHLNGLLKPTTGTVTVDGVDTRKTSVAKLSRKVGLVFQNPDHLLFSETVVDEVAFALKNFGYAPDIIAKQVGETLEALDLTGYGNTSPFLLSGGERKRVALAAVLAWEPDYLVLDEPTIGQDYQQKERLSNFILQLYSQGKTVVMITHDVEFVAETNPTVVLMSKGSILARGRADEVLSNDDLVEKSSLVKPQMAKLFTLLEGQGLPHDVVDVHRAKMLLEDKLGGVAGHVSKSS
jgi:energy-coupling factor transport system ATP-binding protein